MVLSLVLVVLLEVDALDVVVVEVVALEVVVVPGGAPPMVLKCHWMPETRPD